MLWVNEDNNRVFKSKPIDNEIKKLNNKQISLILLNVKALNEAFSVDIRIDQKFIKKKEVTPISSQPKNKEKKL